MIQLLVILFALVTACGGSESTASVRTTTEMDFTRTPNCSGTIVVGQGDCWVKAGTPQPPTEPWNTCPSSAAVCACGSLTFEYTFYANGGPAGVPSNPIVATANGLRSFRVIGGKTCEMKDKLDKPVTVAWGGMDPLGVCHDP